MPLSITKLQQLLQSKGYIPSKYFVLEKYVCFIELLYIKNATTFLLYIPSKYNFVPTSDMDSYTITYIDTESTDGIAEEYTENGNVESMYGDNINLSPDKNEKLEDHLEEYYKHPISLKDISEEDSTELKAIYRQMKRLKYCVQNIKYKVGIIYKNYICAIRRDDSISCFTIKSYPRKDKKQLLVITDLEVFYSKNDKLMSDIETVRKGVHKVLHKNQKLQVKLITKLLENKQLLTSIIEGKKSLKYDSNIEQLENMLNTMNEAEKERLEELYSIKDNNNNMREDIELAHRRGKIETELADISRIKEDIMKILVVLRKQQENSLLSMDKIMFDNIVMVDSIGKNFSKLKNFN